MLNISFFITAFTSIFWIIYSLKLINLEQLLPNPAIEQLYRAMMVVLFPLAVIWSIFAIIKSCWTEKRFAEQTLRILNRLEKNNESATALSCALISAEKEIKNAFTINEFNLLVSDTNEVLADIIKRSNSVSSSQMEHLWTRTAGGERWLMAKTFIETFNFQSGFAEHLLQKAKKDSLLKGSILEFYTRYKQLRQLLELNDTQKLLFNIIEFGAMGKVFQLITPIAQTLYNSPKEPTKQNIKTAIETPKQDFALQEEPTMEFPSFLSDTDSFSSPKQNDTSEPVAAEAINEGLRAIREELLAPALSTPRKAHSIRQDTGLSSFPRLTDEPTAAKKRPHPERKRVISLAELEEEINASPENNYDKYAYPFGAFGDEKKNK